MSTLITCDLLKEVDFQHAIKALYADRACDRHKFYKLCNEYDIKTKIPPINNAAEHPEIDYMSDRNAAIRLIKLYGEDGMKEWKKKRFNSILRFSNAVVTNFTVKDDHIVISFDNNMTLDRCIKYLSSMKEKIIQRFCPDQSILADNFYTKFFPFNSDQGKSAEDNKFLVPIRKEVVSNLKFLLANEIARFATDLIKEQEKEDKKSELGCEDLSDDIEEEIENHVDYNIIDEVFNKGSYLYGAECVDRNLQRSFVNLLLSGIKGYENGPKNPNYGLASKERHRNRGLFRLHGIGNQNRKNMN